MEYMWWLIGYVGLAYLIDWMIDWCWWRYVDYILKGKSNQKPLASSTESQIPSIDLAPRRGRRGKTSAVGREPCFAKR